ncbi:MAG TPA: alpha/beta hydrolase [bacterium]|nr:alpha/beta hydrolase [bacterium]
MNAHFEAIVGRYLRVEAGGVAYRIYVEEAGEGIPLLCLHTAAADTRQYRHLLEDPEVTGRFRVIAFDMPYHGKSNPPDGWWTRKYELASRHYVEIIRAVWQALALERPVVMGCSMGGAVVLELAATYFRELRAIIGLESAAYAPGRSNHFLSHPAVHGGEFAATYSYGLCAPHSPEPMRRENWWYYSQSGPGVYEGDIHFYSSDHDVREAIKSIDTKQCAVFLLSGEYDYSATPDMTRRVAEAIPGAEFVLMTEIGHFPMIENPERFRTYLLPVLDKIATR